MPGLRSKLGSDRFGQTRAFVGDMCLFLSQSYNELFITKRPFSIRTTLRIGCSKKAEQ